MMQFGARCNPQGLCMGALKWSKRFAREICVATSLYVGVNGRGMSKFDVKSHYLPIYVNHLPFISEFWRKTGHFILEAVVEISQFSSRLIFAPKKSCPFKCNLLCNIKLLFQALQKRLTKVHQNSAFSSTNYLT